MGDLTVRNIVVKYLVDTNNQSIEEARKAVDRMKNKTVGSLTQGGNQVTQQLTGMVNGFRSFAMKALGAIGVGFSVGAIKSFADDCVSMASNVEQMQDKFNAVFRGMESEANKWSEDFAHSVGRNANTIKRYVSDNQNLIYGFANSYVEAGKMTEGEARHVSAQISENATSLAMDIASFANIEDDRAQELMTKFLMGESEAGRALGLAANDITRNEASMSLFGKKYKDLDMLEKMQANYNLALKQSPDAIGNTVRELDTYESRMRQAKAAQDEFKESLGQKLIPVQKILAQIQARTYGKMTDLVKSFFESKKVTEGLAYVSENLEKILAKVDPIIDGIISTIKNGATNVNNFVKMFGGWGKALKVVIPLLIALKAKTMFAGSVSNLAGAFSVLKKVIASPLGATSWILLTILAVQDLMDFMNGVDETAIGKIFDTFGVSADEGREKIGEAITYIKGLVSNVVTFVMENKDTILSVLQGLLMAFATFKIIMTIISLVSALGTVFSALGAAIAFLMSPIGLIIAGIAALIAIGVLLYQHWDTLKAKASEAGQGIISGFNSAVEYLKSLPDKAYVWGSDFVSGLIRGIEGKFPHVTGAIKTVAGGISKFLHFSRPDVGPLRNYETWMPDMMYGLARGIKNNQRPILQALDMTTRNIQAMVQATVPSAAVASNSRFITQNVTISNQFNGSDRQNMVSGAKAMDASAKSATDYMADALNLGR